MRYLLFSAVACVAIAMPLQAQTGDELHATIDRALKAQGGADKVAALKACIARLKGTINIGGENADFTVEVYDQPPTKSKSIIQLGIPGMKLEIVEVFDGDKGWTSVAGGPPMDADTEQVKEHLEMRYIDEVTNLVILKSDKAVKLSPLAEIKVGGAPCVGVLVTKKDKRDVSLFFDKKTHLLVKAEYRALDSLTMQEVNQEKVYSAYKELVPGLKLASKEVVKNDGTLFTDTEITEVRPVQRHDDSVFAKPK